MEESKSNYYQQYRQLDNQINLFTSSKQTNQSTSIANNRVSFPQTTMQAQTVQKPTVPSRAFSSPPQKVNPNRRSDQRSHKRINVTHSDRNRAAASNSNNVWCRAEQFFTHLPTDREIDTIFSIRKIPEIKEIDGEIKHWSSRVAPPNCRANGKAMMPPGPPSSSDDVAEYWSANRPWFQIEKMQRSNCSPLHCLLNAFVEILPEELSNRPERTKLFARTHPLLPQIDSNGYTKFAFDVRLNLELESLGLNQPQQSSNKDRPFQSEILDLKNKTVNETIPAIDRYFDEIKTNIEEYRADQKLRNERTEMVENMISEFNSKKRKRKE